MMTRALYQVKGQRSMPLLFKKFFHFKCGQAPCASGCDSLAVAAVLHVSASEYARHPRENVILCDQVTVGIGFQLAFEDFSVWDMANTEKHCASREVPALAAL